MGYKQKPFFFKWFKMINGYHYIWFLQFDCKWFQNEWIQFSFWDLHQHFQWRARFDCHRVFEVRWVCRWLASNRCWIWSHRCRSLSKQMWNQTVTYYYITIALQGINDNKTVFYLLLLLKLNGLNLSLKTAHQRFWKHSQPWHLWRLAHWSTTSCQENLQMRAFHHFEMKTRHIFYLRMDWPELSELIISGLHLKQIVLFNGIETLYELIRILYISISCIYFKSAFSSGKFMIFDFSSRTDKSFTVYSGSHSWNLCKALNEENSKLKTYQHSNLLIGNVYYLIISFFERNVNSCKIFNKNLMKW